MKTAINTLDGSMLGNRSLADKFLKGSSKSSKMSSTMVGRQRKW